MTEPLHPVHEAYAKALAEGGPASIPLGRDVLCDACDTDLTDDPRSGGNLFGTYAYGPCCADSRLKAIKGYGEEKFIRAWCPVYLSFADWVRGLRGPGAAITITPGLPGRPL